MLSLPKEYIENMQKLLGDEYNAYEAALLQPRKYGLRINTNKISEEEFVKNFPINLTKIDFVSGGYYYDNEEQPAKHPYYYAGLYYLQEPSAMLPADRLDINENDKVLDLCAAPGGKSTAILKKLNGTGFLLANDISAKRASVLLKNLEMQGYDNFFVTAEDPINLQRYFRGFFDKILVDAPCSGEGMFRKDPGLIDAWIENGPEYYSKIQASILHSAIDMLKPGGTLMYSTCTFSILEDEGTISEVLKNHEDMEILDIKPYKGFENGKIGLNKCVRIFPHKMDGEGHFLCLLKKKDDVTGTDIRPVFNNKKFKKFVVNPKQHYDYLDFISHYEGALDPNELYISDNILYQIKKGSEGFIHQSLRYLRTGNLIGEFDKHMKFEPSSVFSRGLSQESFSNNISFSCDDDRVIRYLKGETIFIDASDGVSLQKGYVLVMVDNYPLGWAKYVGNGQLKNKYKISWKME